MIYIERVPIWQEFQVDLPCRVLLKQRRKYTTLVATPNRAPIPKDLCESRGGSPGLPFLNSHYGLCGRKITSEEKDI